MHKLMWIGVLVISTLLEAFPLYQPVPRYTSLSLPISNKWARANGVIQVGPTIVSETIAEGHLTLIKEHIKGASLDCNQFGISNGCSTPFGLKFPFQSHFETECHRHDWCYHCGHTLNIPRKMCDNGFLKDQKQMCDKDLRNNFLGNILCKGAAYFAHVAIRIFGGGHYEHRIRTNCGGHLLSACLPGDHLRQSYGR